MMTWQSGIGKSFQPKPSGTGASEDYIKDLWAKIVKAQIGLNIKSVDFPGGVFPSAIQSSPVAITRWDFLKSPEDIAILGVGHFLGHIQLAAIDGNFEGHIKLLVHQGTETPVDAPAGISGGASTPLNSKYWQSNGAWGLANPNAVGAAIENLIFIGSNYDEHNASSAVHPLMSGRTFWPPGQAYIVAKNQWLILQALANFIAAAGVNNIPANSVQADVQIYYCDIRRTAAIAGIV